jgi:glycerol uptake operon antiterminator
MIEGKIIPAVRTTEDLKLALETSVKSVFLLNTNIEDVGEQIEITHRAGKKLFIHFDLADGIGKDEYGIKYLSSLGADGIISTRTNVIKTAKRLGVYTIQRFFIVDSRSIDTTVESVSASKADVIEIMPGAVPKIITKVKNLVDMPIVAGGIIETEEEICDALNSGAIAISTGKKDLW